METFSALLANCARNSPVTGEFPAQRPVTQSFDVFFDLHLNKRLSKQQRGWWFETPSRSLWRHCNAVAWHNYTMASPSRKKTVPILRNGPLPRRQLHDNGTKGSLVVNLGGFWKRVANHAKSPSGLNTIIQSQKVESPSYSGRFCLLCKFLDSNVLSLWPSDFTASWEHIDYLYHDL